MGFPVRCYGELPGVCPLYTPTWTGFHLEYCPWGLCSSASSHRWWQSHAIASPPPLSRDAALATASPPAPCRDQGFGVRVQGCGFLGSEIIIEYRQWRLRLIFGEVQRKPRLNSSYCCVVQFVVQIVEINESRDLHIKINKSRDLEINESRDYEFVGLFASGRGGGALIISGRGKY